MNSLVQWVFARVRLHQAPAGAQLRAYPSVHVGTGFVALTMKLSGGDERKEFGLPTGDGSFEVPVAFVSRYLSLTE